MGDRAGSRNYRIEVSGWDLNDVFFVEKSDLLWSDGGEKGCYFTMHCPKAP